MDVVFRVLEGSEEERCRAEGEPVTLPADYNEYAVWVETLQSSGLLEYLKKVVLARRAGSFELIDLVLFLGCFFSASSKLTSIADFAQESKRYGQELAAVGGRARWITQASISRALAAVSEATAREFVRRIFAVTGRAVLESKLCDAMGYRDGTGASWRIFHWDTSADTVRKRALPESEELPEGSRLSDDLARPGYAGRKRGEGVFSRSIVSDATSSVWVHMDLGSGSGSVTEQLALAVDDTVAYLGGCRQALGESVMVCDGVSGGVPQTRAVLSGGMQILTRVANYECLRTERARKIIENSNWLPVEDSRSGPQREAIDLGNRRIEGRQLRVIASRFPVDKSKQKKGRGAGTTIDEWHYELFLSSLPIQGWAANDLVTLYYGRTAIENRFAAEDRIFNLSRVFSFSPPGQLLASGIAMAIWNLRVIAGLVAVSQETPHRPFRPRPGFADETPVPAEAEAETEVETEVETETEAETEAEAETETTTQITAPSVDEDETLAESEMESTSEVDEAFIVEVAEEWCTHQPDWSVEDNTLRCPAGALLQRSIRLRAEHLVVRFRAPLAACRDCPLRAQCTTSSSPTFRKEVPLSLGLHAPHEEALSVSEPPMAIRDAQPQLPRFLPDAPILVPTRLQKLATNAMRTGLLKVIAPEVDPPPPPEEHIAPEIEDRQRRRHTIAKRIAANARADDAATVTLHAPAAFISMLEGVKKSVRSA